VNGPIDEAGATARSVIEGLKSQPALLALVLMNCVIFALIAWSTHTTRVLQADVTKTTLEQQASAQKLLADCIQPAQLERILELYRNGPRTELESEGQDDLP